MVILITVVSGNHFLDSAFNHRVYKTLKAKDGKIKRLVLLEQYSIQQRHSVYYHKGIRKAANICI